jgi:LacI family transcriptional regulator
VKGTRRRPVGLREVAEHADVAMSSVSRVLTEHPDVSDRMRERVLAAAQELGYEPDLLAQSLRRGETLSVGFVVRDISNPILAEIALGAETKLRRAGYSMLLTNSEGRPQLDAEGIRLFRRRRVDGLLLSLSDETAERTVEEVNQVGAPLVLIDRELPDRPALSAVRADHETSAREAIRALTDAGHRRIGMVLGQPTIYPMRVCASVLEEECARAGATGMTESGAFRPEDGAAATARLLDRPQPPTALLTTSNQLFVGTLRTLRERGLSIPGEISVITFDDVPLLDLIEPPIAVVSRRPLELGRAAAGELLRRMLGDEEGSKVVTTPTSFDPRDSIAPPPGAGAE